MPVRFLKDILIYRAEWFGYRFENISKSRTSVFEPFSTHSTNFNEFDTVSTIELEDTLLAIIMPLKGHYPSLDTACLFLV